MKISLCMIVKDEEEFLPRCLMSIKKFVDEMIVVDTGSTDRSKFIAEFLGAKVYDYPWNNSFSDARNFSIEKATGDWILVLDADEELDFCAQWAFKEFFNQMKEQKHLVNPVSFRFKNFHDMGFVTIEHFHARMFPNTGEYHYEGRMHEQVRRVDGKPCAHVKAPQIVINHYGYTGTKNDEKGKVERNISLLKAQIQDNPEYPFYYFNLMNCYVVDGRFKEALEVFKDLKKREHIAIVNGCPVSYLPDAYKLASISYFELKDFENALKFALNGLEMLPDSPGLCYSAGLALFTMNNFELALRYADKAIEYKKNATVETLHDPSASSWKAKKIKGLALANMRRFKEAKAILEEAINEIPIPDPVLISAYNSVCKAV